MKRKFFMICSTGQTATRWLSRALSAHPEIYCLHSTGEPEDILNQVSSKNVFSERVTKDIERDPDKLVTRMEKITDAPYLGYVHRHTAWSYLEYKNAQSLSATFNLVRHPVNRIEALYGHFNKARDQYMIDNANESFEVAASLAKEMSTKYDVDFSDMANRFFFFSVWYASIWNEEMKIFFGDPDLGQNTIIPMERVTVDREYFCWLLKRIAPDKQSDLAFISEIFDQSSIHNKSDSNKTVKYSCAEDLFNKWEPWKQEMLSIYFHRNNMIELPEKLGYDLSFINT